MPLSHAIIEAIREDSRSNGSGSREGEAEGKSRRLKSHIDPQSFVIPGEDPAELEMVMESYQESYGPGTALEWFLVDSLIVADWEMRRLQKMRAEVLRKEIQAGATVAEAYERPVLARLEQRKTAVERSFYRAYKEIEKILKQEDEAEAKNQKKQKEQGRIAVAAVSAMTKLASLRQKKGKAAEGALRPADAGAAGRGSAAAAVSSSGAVTAPLAERKP
jgi:hypothetical protein